MFRRLMTVIAVVLVFAAIAPPVSTQVVGDMVTINGMFSNGEGYDKSEDTAFRKAMEVQGILTPVDGLTVSAHFGLNGYDEDGDPDTTGDQDDDETTYFLVGLDYEAGPGLNIIPNFRSTTVGSGDAESSFLITFYWKW